ncbi:hypothetical protein C8J57DRAFT_1719098 [Mycena rebaudengoi]|nr:hypothetical protein C8J57DRAFT_1719098 [Mycena rebaudengoi]
MAHKAVELFRGDCTAEKAQVWLRTLEGSFTESTKEETKLYKFGRSLYPGGAAEKWWRGLAVADKADFDTLVKAFDKQWPMPQFTARPKALVISEIKANKLHMGDVGQVVKDEDGAEVLSHQGWAQRTRKLLADIPGGDGDMLLMEHVRDGLPVGLRRLIPNEPALDSWAKWLAAVEAIDLHAINDLREEQGLPRSTLGDPETTWTVAATATQSEAAFTHLAQALGMTHLLSPGRSPRRTTATYVPQTARHSQREFPQTTQPTTQPTTPYPTHYPSTPSRPPPPHMGSSDVFGGSTIRPPTNFTKNLFATPQSPSAGRGRYTGQTPSLSGDPARDAETARAVARSPRLYNTDATSSQRYTTDMAAWIAGPRDYTIFPFTPGTIAPGSRECWRCGTLTSPPHGAGSCGSTHQVPQLEYNVRRFVGQILHPPGQRAGIAQINEAPYDPFGGLDPEQPVYDEDDGDAVSDSE